MVLTKKRQIGQSSIEFMILFGVILFFFVGIMAIIYSNIEIKNREKREVYAQNMALDVQNEIKMAFESTDGYFREFTLPKTLIGKDYKIEIIADSVYITSDRIAMSYKVTPVAGVLVKGANNITKQNGAVQINP